MPDSSSDSQKQPRDRHLLDAQVIHSAMRKTGGSYPKAVQVLRALGWEDLTEHVLAKKVDEHSALKALWSRGKGSEITGVSTTEEPDNNFSLVKRGGSDEVDESIIAKLDERIALEGIESIVGKANVDRFEKLANFSSSAFYQSLEYTYGNAMVAQMELTERASQIKEILNDETMIDKEVVNDDGSVTTYQDYKYPLDYKASLEKTLVEIYDLIRKFSDSATNAATARINAQKTINETKKAQPPKAGRGRRRLRNEPLDV